MGRAESAALGYLLAPLSPCTIYLKRSLVKRQIRIVCSLPLSPRNEPNRWVAPH